MNIHRLLKKDLFKNFNSKILRSKFSSDVKVKVTKWYLKTKKVTFF